MKSVKDNSTKISWAFVVTRSGYMNVAKVRKNRINSAFHGL
nr:MAG TPA: Renal amino acid transporter [Bacteriophage sp.]